MVYKDLEKKKRTRKAWKEANKEKLAKEGKSYRARSKKVHEAYRSKNREKIRTDMRNAARKRSSGWTPEQFNEALLRQESMCEICDVIMTEEPNRINSATADHDHDTGKLRGILCNKCNKLEGIVKNISKEWYTRLRAYLEKYES